MFPTALTGGSTNSGVLSLSSVSSVPKIAHNNDNTGNHGATSTSNNDRHFSIDPYDPCIRYAALSATPATVPPTTITPLRSSSVAAVFGQQEDFGDDATNENDFNSTNYTRNVSIPVEARSGKLPPSVQNGSSQSPIVSPLPASVAASVTQELIIRKK